LLSSHFSSIDFADTNQTGNQQNCFTIECAPQSCAFGKSITSAGVKNRFTILASGFERNLRMRKEFFKNKAGILGFYPLLIIAVAMLFLNHRASLAPEPSLTADSVSATAQQPCPTLPIDVKVPGDGYGEGGNVAAKDQAFSAISLPISVL
jgi:hypothetical protein